jgi:hypothetical protein
MEMRSDPNDGGCQLWKPGFIWYHRANRHTRAGELGRPERVGGEERTEKKRKII